MRLARLKHQLVGLWSWRSAGRADSRELSAEESGWLDRLAAIKELERTDARTADLLSRFVAIPRDRAQIDVLSASSSMSEDAMADIGPNLRPASGVVPFPKPPRDDRETIATLAAELQRQTTKALDLRDERIDKLEASNRRLEADLERTEADLRQREQENLALRDHLRDAREALTRTQARLEHCEAVIQRWRFVLKCIGWIAIAIVAFAIFRAGQT